MKLSYDGEERKITASMQPCYAVRTSYHIPSRTHRISGDPYLMKPRSYPVGANVEDIRLYRDIVNWVQSTH